MNKCVAIITARGGSKRIPRKNIKQFLGEPIINYSIKAALASGCFDEVMVSTDDEEIAEVARKAGAIVPFKRSEVNSDDYSKLNFSNNISFLWKYYFQTSSICNFKFRTYLIWTICN